MAKNNRNYKQFSKVEDTDVKPNRAHGQKPFFSFEYVCSDKYCFKKCTLDELKSLLEKLRILSSQDWATLDNLPREKSFEPIPVGQIKATIPQQFADHKKLLVARFGNNKGRIIGIQDIEKFYILFIERDFKAYKHS